MRIIFLGTGTSHGVPALDCMLGTFQSCPPDLYRRARADRYLARTRASIAVEADEGTLLIDTSQDFRQQMLESRLPRIDAVLFTHTHADHVHGLPDIRSYCRLHEGAMPVYGSGETLAELRTSFRYVFERPEGYVGGGIPSLEARVLDGQPVRILGLTVTPIPVEHGPLNGCCGYRMNDVAYLPDVKRIPEASRALLTGLDLLILNCLRPRAHVSHLSIQESLAYVAELAPRRTLLTHMAHDVDAAVHGKLLPKNVGFAYDGMAVLA
jgi:phosphoribosyl 1,2-cyclic phosphate phosphodiesterase